MVFSWADPVNPRIPYVEKTRPERASTQPKNPARGRDATHVENCARNMFFDGRPTTSFVRGHRLFFSNSFSPVNFGGAVPAPAWPEECPVRVIFPPPVSKPYGSRVSTTRRVRGSPRRRDIFGRVVSRATQGQPRMFLPSRPWCPRALLASEFACKTAPDRAAKRHVWPDSGSHLLGPCGQILRAGGVRCFSSHSRNHETFRVSLTVKEFPPRPESAQCGSAHVSRR